MTSILYRALLWLAILFMLGLCVVYRSLALNADNIHGTIVYGDSPAKSTMTESPTELISTINNITAYNAFIAAYYTKEITEAERKRSMLKFMVVTYRQEQTEIFISLSPEQQHISDEQPICSYSFW